MAVAPPVANFVANETSVCPYQTIQFTDTTVSFGNLTWFWLFGDSQDSHIQNPTHYYDTPGIYNVSLWVQDEWGNDTELKNNYITVNDCYSADFTANQTCSIGLNSVVTLNSTCNVSLGKQVWLIYPGGWSYWNGTYWVLPISNMFDGDDSGTLNPMINFTSYGIYNITQGCNFGPPVGMVELTKYNYTTIGVEGTFCDGNCSVIYTKMEDPPYLIIGAIIGLFLSMIIISRRQT